MRHSLFVFALALSTALASNPASAYRILTQAAAQVDGISDTDQFFETDGATSGSAGASVTDTCDATTPPCSNTFPPRDSAFATSTATASANLATGELKILVDKGFRSGDDFLGTLANASASFTDTIQITGVAPELQNQTIFATFTLAIDGVTGGDLNFTGTSLASLSVSGLSTESDSLLTADLPLGAFSDTLSVTVPIYNPNVFNPIDIVITANMGIGTFGNALPTLVDASNTATLDILLPDGVMGFISESGVLLSEAGNDGNGADIPEPSALALFAIALGGLGFMTRRRRI